MDAFLSDRIADDGQPSIQLIRNPRLGNAGLSDHRDSDRHLGVSVGIPLWVSGYGPSLELEGWPSGGSTPKVLYANVESRNTTHTDTRLAPNGTTIDEPHTLKKMEGHRVVDSVRKIFWLTAQRLDILSP